MYHNKVKPLIVNSFLLKKSLQDKQDWKTLLYMYGYVYNRYNSFDWDIDPIVI